MKNLFFNIFTTLILLVSTNAFAAGSFEHSNQASKNSVQAVGHSSVAGGKVLSGVVAIPLTIAGDIGEMSGEAGDVLMEQANKPIGEPLEITDEVITAGPSPKEVVHSQENLQ